MAGRFTVIPQDTFDALQLDAGILLSDFDPSDPEVLDENLICATTGGIKPSCVPTYSDFGADVDNVPNNMMEFKHLDGWDCKIITTGLGTSTKLIQMALGAADITDETQVDPRNKVELTDFKSIWWVGDKANGGFVAVHLKNALSTGGFSLQTSKNGKGTTAIELTGHVSIDAQDEVPMTFYSIDPAEPEPTPTPTPTPTTPSVTLNKDATTIVANATETLTATTVPADAEVSWSSSNDEVATVEDGVVTAVAEGEAVITATITVDETDYTDTCTVTVSNGV